MSCLNLILFSQKERFLPEFLVFFPVILLLLTSYCWTIVATGSEFAIGSPVLWGNRTFCAKYQEEQEN